MQEIILPSLAGALLAISWYWLMDLLPPFRAARRTTSVVTRTEVPTPPPEVPAAQPEARQPETGVGIGQMIGYIVIAAALAKRQQAQRIAVLQTGTARADIPALQEAVGASHEVILVSVDQALQTRYDLLLSVGNQPGAVPMSIQNAYDMTLELREIGENIRVAIGTPKV